MKPLGKQDGNQKEKKVEIEKNRLNSVEQQEVKLRVNIISQKKAELKLLDNEYQMYVRSLLEQKGLNTTKMYDIGVDGELIEKK